MTVARGPSGTKRRDVRPDVRTFTSVATLAPAFATKIVAAHGLWKYRLHDAIVTGRSSFDPTVVARDDRCPFGTVNYVQDTGKVQKCDLCGGSPACAEACPTGAITYVDADWTGLGKMRQWAERLDNQPAAGNAD